MQHKDGIIAMVSSLASPTPLDPNVLLVVLGCLVDGHHYTGVLAQQGVEDDTAHAPVAVAEGMDLDKVVRVLCCHGEGVDFCLKIVVAGVDGGEEAWFMVAAIPSASRAIIAGMYFGLAKFVVPAEAWTVR